MAEEEILEARMYVDGMFAVDCPHCHVSWYGTGVVDAADTGEIQACGRYSVRCLPSLR
ncbi:MAG: hypothetical protein UY44_C0014G0004 [Candidatus Kaiserbacteria bacterium GW2011_GWA2_49_19]|uniref:Uncharacterized protein n=1 Tax=Candidatus Kaiserbacteria bacterium GW2011_GWA2_49_19 TaxID=1618669 RepID=A0A0G1XZZ5_9BACT|nr:MAG: hypothetical protein UY44_C0014G0004 [Candidatus Kaiserbacteria bacterium GW2011_GWA2_49_19]